MLNTSPSSWFEVVVLRGLLLLQRIKESLHWVCVLDVAARPVLHDRETEIAGIKRRFRFHDQRHTFASILATNGINAFTLRDLLGHTSTRTTERYARPSTQALAAVEQALS